MSLTSRKPLYQPWNEEEFRGDMSVIAMTPIQRYIYRTLIQAAFFCSTRPFLPADDEALCQLSWCENKSQWDRNKSKVLAKFTPVIVSGVKLLKHKRIVADWQRIVKKRKTLAASGKKGGEANAEANATAIGKQGYSREEKGSEVEAKAKESEGEVEISMSLKNNITDKCRTILKIRIRPDDRDWKEIANLSRLYDHGRILDAFENWATSQQGQAIKYPLSEFVKLSDGLIDGTIDLGISPGTEELLGDLYAVSQRAFTGKYMFAAKELAKKYGAEEVVASYTEFCNNLDDFKKQNAPKEFCEGGAIAVISDRKKRRIEEKAAKARMTDIIAQERVEAEREMAERDARETAAKADNFGF